MRWSAFYRVKVIMDALSLVAIAVRGSWNPATSVPLRRPQLNSAFRSIPCSFTSNRGCQNHMHEGKEMRDGHPFTSLNITVLKTVSRSTLGPALCGSSRIWLIRTRAPLKTPRRRQIVERHAELIVSGNINKDKKNAIAAYIPTAIRRLVRIR